MMLRLFVNVIGDLLLIALAGDLLYLYYIGAWQDSTHWIEVTEVGLLYLVIVFALGRLYFHLRRSS